MPFSSDDGEGVATIHSAEWTTEDKYGDKAEQGAYLTLDISIESVSGDATGTNPFDWEAKDADGRVYNADISAPEPQLHSTSMVPGDTVRGFLSFDLPKGTTSVRLIDGLEGKPLAVWTVK